MPFLAKQHVEVSNQDLLSWTFDRPSYDQDRAIYIDALDPGLSFSARQAQKTIKQLIAGFRALGLKKGECVCIHSYNNIYYPIAFLAIIGAGGVVTGTNPAYLPLELSHALRVVKCRFVLVQPELLPSMQQACRQVNIPSSAIILFNPNSNVDQFSFTQWHSLFEHGEEDWLRFDDEKVSTNTTASLSFSSGTTGLPKAAMMSHRNYIAYHTAMYDHESRTGTSRRLFAFPMFHATVPAAHTSPLKSGDIAYVLPRFDLEKWLWANEKYQITEVLLLPPVVIMAINSPLRDRYSFRAAQCAFVGAAPLDKAPQARMQALLGNAPLAQVWGMTEATCVATRFEIGESDTTGSVGRPIRGIDIKIVDDQGKDISGFDVRGELCLRGPTICQGYFENPEANSRDWDVDGYYHTGDIGYCDSQSKLWYIVDRKKELIKVRAFQVAPPEIEGLLLSHPDVVDAAVIGVPNPKDSGSEMPRAYLVRRAGSSGPSIDEVHSLVRQNLSSYKALTGGVIFVEMIPKTASGKILKRILREQANKEIRAKL